MNPEDIDINAYLEHAAARIGLPIAPEYRASVCAYFSLTVQMAARLYEQPLPPEVEPAPVFEP
ncbi:MAG: DUF4089 domain-containing protein [Gammaproteobacteria bacterium]